MCVMYSSIMNVFLVMQVHSGVVRQGIWAGCQCPNAIDPVCGSDSVTYQNPCMLTCARTLNPTITLLGRGYCGDVTRPCWCYPDDKPLCGSDGRNYANKCQLECQKINGRPTLHASYLGRCTDNRKKQREYSIFFALPPTTEKLSVVVRKTTTQNVPAQNTADNGTLPNVSGGNDTGQNGTEVNETQPNGTKANETQPNDGS